jgi:hypothetical protein
VIQARTVVVRAAGACRFRMTLSVAASDFVNLRGKCGPALGTAGNNRRQRTTSKGCRERNRPS